MRSTQSLPPSSQTQFPFWRQLRWNLVLSFFILAGLPLAILLIVIFDQLETQASEQVMGQLESIVILKQERIATWLSDSEFMLDLFLIDPVREEIFTTFAASTGSGSDATNNVSPQNAINNLLGDAVAAQTSFEEFFLYDAGGRIVAASNLARIGQNVSGEAYYEASLRQNGLQTSSPDVDDAGLTMLMTRVLTDGNGQVKGVLAGRLDPNVLWQIVTDRTGLGDSGEIYLVTAGSNGSSSLVRFGAEGQLTTRVTGGIEQVLNGESGSGIVASSRNPSAAVIGANRWIPELQMGLLAEVEKRKALAWLISLRNYSLGIAGLITAVVVILGLYNATYISKPIAKLAQAATRLAQGDLSGRASVAGPDEVGLLATTFNAMAAQLQQIRVAVDNITEAIQLADPSGQAIYHNKAFTELLEYMPAELNAAGGPPSLFANQTVASEVFETIRQGQAWRGETELCARSGRIIPVNLRASTITDENGETIAVVGTITDITERKQTEESLAQERHLLRTLIDNLPDRIYVKNSRGQFAIANKSMLNYFGLTGEEELVGKTEFDLLPDESATRNRAIEQVILQTGRPEIDVEELYVDEAGQERWVSGSKIPLRYGQSRVVGLVGVDHDITERKRAEMKFKESLELIERAKQEWESTVDSLSQLVCLIDYDGCVMRANRTVERWGLAQVVEVKGRTLHELLHPNCTDPTCYLKGLWAEARGALARNELVDLEIEDETLGRYLHIQARPISAQTSRMRYVGVASYAVMVIQDITERKLVEAELNQHHRHLEAMVEARTAELNAYRETLEELVYARTVDLKHALEDVAQARDETAAILNSAADGLIVTDLSYRVTRLNPAAEELLGLDREEVVGQEISAGIKDLRLRKLIQNTLNQKTNDSEVDVEIENPLNGRQKVLRARTALVTNQEGQPSGTVTIIRDVTHEREIDRLKTEFLSTAAHELRTPLTSVLGFSEILLARQLHEDRQRRYLTLIHQQADHMADVINSLLDVSRLEAGRGLEIKPEPTHLAKLLEDVILPFKETSTQHQLQVDGMAELPPVICDSFRLQQVFRNLVSNAIRYSPEGGTVTVRGRVAVGQIEISVQDEGIGMTGLQQEHLFEKFYRADPSNTAIGGTGLGLFISKLIVELHGGEIWAKSKQNVGTTIFFTLPLRS